MEYGGGEGAGSSQALLGLPPSQNLYLLTSLDAPPISLWKFLHTLISSTPFPFPEEGECVGLKIPTLQSLDLFGDQPHPRLSRDSTQSV